MALIRAVIWGVGISKVVGALADTGRIERGTGMSEPEQGDNYGGWWESAKESTQIPQPANQEAATLAVGVIQLAQASVVDVPVPGTLETVVVPTRPDTIYDLPEGAEGAQAHQVDGDLLLTFPNGGLVEFSGFASASDSVQFHTPDKGSLSADNFLHELQPHGESSSAPIDNPDFSPGPAPEALAALSPIGALAPTELHFTEAAFQFHSAASAGPLALGENDPLATIDIDQGMPTAPSGELLLFRQSLVPTADPDLGAVRAVDWSQIVDNGQPIPLPGDDDGDPITIKIVSLPPEFDSVVNPNVRVDLYVDNNGTPQPLHVDDVLTLDQLQNNLFYWTAVAGDGGRTTPAVGDLVYSVTDTHQHTVMGDIQLIVPFRNE